MKLAGKIALITGGSRGIGRATALAFAAEGADIAFCHLDDHAKADETAGEIRGLGRRALHRSVDVADIAAARRFADEAALELGSVDILFNNAGINIRKPFEAYTEEEFDRILSVHLKGMFFMAQSVYLAMVARGRGCIINIASQRGLKGAVNSAPYSAAKGPDRDHDARRSPGLHRCAADRSLRPAGRDRRDRAAAGGSGRRILCRRNPVAQRGRRDVLGATNSGEKQMAATDLAPGLKAEIVTTVDDKLVVTHMGGDGVLSTPSMIGLMERAGIQAVQSHLPEGHTTVGFEVNVKHFGATPKGKKVTVRAELLEVDGRKLRFKVEAHDEDKKVGEGTHRRAIVAIQRKG